MKRTILTSLGLISLFYFSACTPKPNGNLCEPDTAKFCLGMQGISRAANVKCLRDHLADLSPDCQKVMADENQVQ